MNLIQKYSDAFSHFDNNNAFCLGIEKYSYREFLSFINGSRALLESQPEFIPKKPVGVLFNEFAETYAAIFATWFSGGIFVPLNPSAPASVNEKIIRKYNIELVFLTDTNQKKFSFPRVKILNNRKISSSDSSPLYSWNENETLYVLNTSGSTGTPKNVPVNLGNVTAFTEGFIENYPELNASDKFLQTYDLTADAAFTGYLIPFLLGAAVYSVPTNGFKPFAVAKILSGEPITWVKATPSLLACLRPFFSSFHLPGIKHFHFGGEALPVDMTEEWRRHIPNAEISNGYGPTETTVTATIYKCLPGKQLKQKYNVVSIGRPLKKVKVSIQKITDQEGKTGELYIGGAQMMEGYWFSEEEQPFKTIKVKGQNQKFYPTGDQVQQDGEGYLYFMGRLNDQVKINGYRIDLIEIENNVRKIVAGSGNVAAVAVEKTPGMKQLVVFIENFPGDGNDITEQMTLHFPHYKIPEKIIGVPQFPINSSGKTDKKVLVSQFLHSSEK
jgi:D-alanine--poly(phosphoribitol) ligase subunit 1